MRFKNTARLRKKYPRFIYRGYSFEQKKNDLEIVFNFSIPPDFVFKPRVLIKNIPPGSLKRVGEEVLNNLVFNLGLVEMLSYWKAVCSPEIIVEAGELNKEQIKWWHDLILRGMGQYFFENKIDFRRPDFLKIHSITHDEKFTIVDFPYGVRQGLKNRFLVPLAGGKDSIVALEILKKAKKEIKYFCLNPSKATSLVLKVANGKNPIIVKRQIDKKLFELNKQGFLNGHTPFSAYLAFLSVLSAVIFDYQYIAFANERSANEGNVNYLGWEINHQYSKSFEFEQKFRKYCSKYLFKKIEYFSFLRPLYEMQIAKIFSRYSQYFKTFLSCNQKAKTAGGKEKWCGQCPKCLFVFASLYPFLGEKKMKEIFGKNLFEKKELLPLMQVLTGERGFKPFECVGTRKESLVAFYLSWEDYREQFSVDSKMPVLLKYFEKKVLPRHKNLAKQAKDILSSWNSRHNLPLELEKILRAEI